MSLLPSRGPDASAAQEGEMQVVGVDEDVEPLLDALASDTARAVLNAIYEDPGTPSEIADRLEMSIQKVSYHLDKLEDRDLIAVAGTRYSEKGQEMTVYEPPEEPLVLFVGTPDRKRSLKSMLKRVLPTVGVLALASLVVERLFGGGTRVGSLDLQTTTDGAPAAEAKATATEAAGDTAAGGRGDNFSVTNAEATPEPTEVATAAADGGRYTADVAISAGQTVSPGLAFFLGGVLVLTVVVGFWAHRTYAQTGF